MAKLFIIATRLATTFTPGTYIHSDIIIKSHCQSEQFNSWGLHIYHTQI